MAFYWCIIVEHEIIVELSGTPLECPGRDFLTDRGVVDATTLARLPQLFHYPTLAAALDSDFFNGSSRCILERIEAGV